MLRADAMEDPCVLFDPDFPDNLSISIDNLFKFLDENPDSSTPPHEAPPSGTLKDFHQGNLAHGQVNFEKAFHPQSGMSGSTPVMEDLTELESSHWDSSNCKKEISVGLLFGSEGSFNNFSDICHPSEIDNGNPHFSQYADSKTFCSLTANHPDDWLTLSSSEDNTSLMDSVGGSLDDLITNNFDYQRMDINMPKCSTSSAEGSGLLYLPYTDYVNELYLDSGQENDFVQMGVATSFQAGVEESISDEKKDSLFMPQNGGIDSSHIMLTEKTGFSGTLHDMNTTAVPVSTVQEGNIHAAILMCSSMDPVKTLPDALHAEANTMEVADAICNASDSFLTLLRDSVIDGETAPNQILPDQRFPIFLSREKEAMIHRKDEGEGQLLQLQNSCVTSEVKFSPQEVSLDMAMPEVSVIDLDAPFSGVLCAEQSHCGDTSFSSESSTDSSSVPSHILNRSVVNNAKQPVPDFKIILPSKKQKSLSKDKREDQVPASCYEEYDTVHGYPLNSSLSVDEDADICILDNISNPARPSPPPVHMKLHPVSQQSGFNGLYYPGSGGMRLKADDERLTFRIALQDLSQPKTEASPPDGVLAVPLLRHQRIALSWMVQKETTSLHCSGGILADDQGLGKTISTIALILMERSPSSRSCAVAQKPDELEALNLDDDDDDDNGVTELNVMKRPRNSSHVMMSQTIKRESSVMVLKGRPAAGTLVVCPTSVLRQWADELQNKVTSKANLSFLVYHGSNRTKDPNEIAKYDVVLTTYAIVSMEVPKQPLVDKEDEQKGKVDASGLPSGLISSKKRKNSSNSNMKNQDSSSLEFASRPLARVGWFRVILDEAQSIKNYRTQVARACWGLRAKRRWCLSGTPIQNAVDDLYSYFRFLRYDPYAVYKSFCTTIKIPISRNPTNGYKKLQAVLKTIMLRRTKGTLLDGKPIITLPPKTVTLKKVDFSEEERAFYSTLEAESREQFKEYAAAGTVKQNYVNILLMLLRLRQACDHPLLVKGYDSSSIERSSMEMAKKLPRDKQIDLLSCLEACLAICTICNDPPEDAVVTICGHVFCNQCICEHLTGDDNVCPSAFCKARLTVASVFSRSTLKSCLSGIPYHDCSSATSVPHKVNTTKSCEESLSSDSSKIKAALEILQSLPRSENPSSRISLEKSDDRSTSSENTVNSISASCLMDTSEKRYLESDKSLKIQATEKAIVFSQWTRMLDLLEIPLKDSCIQYRRLDGTMSVAARDKAIKDFNSLPEVTVMIMSLKAASLGLNMVAACHVLLLDLWWNPTTEDQAIDRAHRIGQTRPVTVSRLTVRETVEDRILALQEKKREMVASAFGEDESGTRQTRLTVDDLKYLFMA